MTNEKLVDIQTVIDYLCSKTCAHYPEKNDECELCNKSWIDGINSLPSTSYCASGEQADKAWDMLSEVYDMPDVPDKAKDIIGDMMLMIHQMIVRADESMITDFVAYQREQLCSHKIMELNSVDEAMTHIFIEKTGKAYIEYLDKLGQFEVKPGKKDEDRTRDDEGPKLFGKRTIIEPGEQFIGEDLLKEALDQNADSDKMVKLKKRTITERLIIANSLIASAIADSDNNQFREDTKKTEDVLLNRDDVIKAVDRHTREDGTLDDDISCILEEVSLPEQKKSNSFSKEPSEEVVHEMNCIPALIRCKNCAHSTEWYGQKRRCFLWNEDGIDVWEDGYCNYADRKEKDVPDIHVEKTDFQPGDRFILELGEERSMFNDFRIKGTDLYVETYLLKKLTRFEQEENATADKILIDLAEAIEIVKFECGEWKGLAQTIVNGIKKLPSAQPETNCSEIPNNSDLISRQAALDAVEESRRENHHEDGKEACCHEYEHRHFLKILHELPPAPHELKTGHWILSDVQSAEELRNDNYFYYCSECGKGDVHSKSVAVSFCWNCGAKMLTERRNDG